MFTKNEQKVLQYLKRCPEGASFSDVLRAAALPRSSIHKALKALSERKIVLLGGNKKYSIAPRNLIEQALHEYAAEMRSSIFGSQKEEGKRTLVFSDQYVLPEEYLVQLRNKYHVRTYENSPQYMTDELFNLRTKDAEVIVRFDTPKVDRAFLEARPQLKAIVCPAYFYANIDPELCAQFGVTAHKFDPTSQKYYATTELEYILNVLLSLLKPLYRAAHATAKARTFYFKNHLGEDLAGKSVGIVFSQSDIGNIVRTFQFLGCDVHAANILSTPPSALQFGLSTYQSVEELWDKSDVMIFIDDLGGLLSLDPLLKKEKVPRYIVLRTEDVVYTSEVVRARMLDGGVKGFAADFLPDMFANKTYLHDLQDTLHPIINLPNVLFTPELGTFSHDSLRRSYEYTFRLLMELP